MFNPKMSFEDEVAKNYELLLTASDELEKKNKALACIRHLTQACECVEELDGVDGACEFIIKAIECVSKIFDVKEITTSDEAEEEIQETIDED